MRIAVIVALLLSFILLARGALQSWEDINIPAVGETVNKKGATDAPERQNLALNPQVPSILPDLKQGYLFNESRLLSENAESEETESEEVPEATSALVDMEGLNYVGSIIVGEMRKGLVSFSVSEPSSPATRQPQPRVRTLPPRASRESRKFATLSENEKFYDFRVAQILPEKIVFSKGEAKVEKLLYDPDKERVAVANPSNLGRPVPGQPSAIPPRNARQMQSVRQPTPQPIGQQITQPDATQPPDADMMHPTEPASQATAPALPTRSVRRPQVIQRRRLPMQQ